MKVLKIINRSNIEIMPLRCDIEERRTKSFVLSCFEYRPVGNYTQIRDQFSQYITSVYSTQEKLLNNWRYSIITMYEYFFNFFFFLLNPDFD